MKAESYSDVLIEPQYSEVEHRSNVDLSTELFGLKLELPVISANMKTVTGPDMVYAMSSNGGLGILHRFYTIEDNIQAFQKCHNIMDIISEYVGVSVGVTDIEKERFIALRDAGASLFCIDVAHGHHLNMKNMIEFIRNNSKQENIRLIAGNVATPDGALDLVRWGANIVKVGIGPGSMCTTRKNTGIGYPQLSAIQNIKSEHRAISLIADGGLRTTGCVAKALAAGADAVMMGAILAGTVETPGRVFADDTTDLVNRTYYKIYGGSSSAENKGVNSFVEGKIQKIPFKGKVKYILREIKEGLQSSLSYVGAKNLHEFRQKAKFISMEIGGKLESET